MTRTPEDPKLPAAQALRRAIRLYLEHAYGDRPPAVALRYLPPEGDFDPTVWLMSDLSERTPADAPLREVRSFALRIGNRTYRHMKLRISRPGAERLYVFTVDCHDAVLEAPRGTPDHEALEDLKRINASIAEQITSAWDAADLDTERKYLREKIRRAREGNLTSPGSVESE